LIGALTILLLCQLAGEAVARGAGIPLPGPVIGLVLLLILLAIRGRVPTELRNLSQGLLSHLGLLFVPAGVGVVTQLGALGRDWLAIAVAILVSTAAGLLATGWVMQWLLDRDIR